jgi:hypothetical protein
VRPSLRASRSLVLAVVTAAFVLTGTPNAPAQGQRPPASQSSAKPSESAPARSTNRLAKLAADSAQALEKYRATLEPVLEIYEREVVRQTELAQIAQDLFERGALSADDLQQSRRALAAAQKNVADTRRDRAEADRMLTEARIAEVVRLRPLKLGGYEETAGLVRFNGPANWSLAGDTPKLQRFFAEQFGRALPISAFGQTALHDRMGFDHRHALDVAVHPDSPEGRAFMAYLRASGIPFIAAWGAIPGSTSGAHIHVGQASPRLTARR